MAKMGRPSKEDKLRASRCKANVKYIRKAYSRFEIRLRKDTEADIIEWLESKESVNSYLKALIRKDMEEQKDND